jgi:membrane-associated protease RseP (regulator of RpoE activity)
VLVPPPGRGPSLWKEYGRHALLLVLTALSIHLLWGPVFALSLLAILISHEMGHYLYCRYYRVDATLPFFIPFPLGFGTLGAFIRIRAPFPNRKALFDIGAAGPFAGFVVCLPVLYFGIREAVLAPIAPLGESLSLGEPLLFQVAARLMLGAIPDGMTLSIGPLGLAAWFGMFMTALNLMPIGQLDGGHVTYSLLPRWASTISHVASWVCVALIYFGPNWIVWSILLRVLGRRHPSTLNDAAPAGRVRAWLGLLSLVVFALCFVPNPIVFSWSDVFDALRRLLTSR